LLLCNKNENYNELKLDEAQFLFVVGVKIQQFNILVQFLNLVGMLTVIQRLRKHDDKI
jgi:hypothetical protein